MHVSHMRHSVNLLNINIYQFILSYKPINWIAKTKFMKVLHSTHESGSLEIKDTQCHNHKHNSNVGNNDKNSDDGNDIIKAGKSHKKTNKRKNKKDLISH